MEKSKTGFHIALISLYSSDAIGLRYISSFLKDKGVDVSLIFFKEKHLEADRMSLPSENEYGLLLDYLRDLNPGILGLSLRSSFFGIASTITDRIHHDMDIPVIWGGTHPSIAPEQSIQVADMVCVGEGEHPMLDLVECLSQGRSVDAIENLWIRRGDEIIRNPIRPLFTDLDSLPFPDLEPSNKYLIDENKLTPEDPVTQRFNIDIMGSRGCPYRCTYCCNSVFLDNHKGKGPLIRRRSVDNVLAEIRSAKKWIPDLQRVDFIDEVFAWDKAWSAEFSSKYKEQVNLPFQCAQHPNMVNAEVMAKLKEAGLERVEVGIQSGTEKIRADVFGRPVSDEALFKTAEIINDLGIVPFYDLIVDNPFETEEDKVETLEFILKLPRPFHLRMYPLTYFPNTALTRKALAAGFITEEQVEDKAERTHSKWFVTLDYEWSKRERFWISIYSLTSKSFLPKKLVRWFSHRVILRKHPKPLSAFATLANNVKLAGIALKWLLEGKPIGAIFRQTSRGQSHWQI